MFKGVFGLQNTCVHITQIAEFDPDYCPVIDDSMRTLFIIKSAGLGLGEMPVELLMEINKQFYGSPVITKAEKYTTSVEGKKHGHYQSFDKRRDLRIDCYWRNGVLHGRYRKVERNSIVSLRCNYVDNSQYGKVIKYAAMVVREEYTLIDGKRQGYYKLFESDGTLHEEYTYEDNKLHGTHTTYWKNGRIHKLSTYDRGLLHGTETAYSALRIMYYMVSGCGITKVRFYWREITLMVVILIWTRMIVV